MNNKNGGNGQQSSSDLERFEHPGRKLAIGFFKVVGLVILAIAAVAIFS